MLQPRPLKVLVVEDQLDLATTTAELLRLEGHEVQMAADGLAALDAAQAHEPDVVLLDIGLPTMDGFEVARRLRPSSARKLYIIALTAYDSEADRRRSAEAGIDLHLTKPTDPELLLRILQNRRLGLTTST
jgi:two-component system CheB/CheR fusion protein